MKPPWQPMETAPKDGKPILALCDHEADQRYESENPQRLSLYAAHYEGLSHVEDGYHVIVWGGGWDDRDYFNSDAGHLPDWWFRFGSDFEEAANPIAWMPIPE